MKQSKLGTASCVVFGLVFLCGAGSAISLATMPAPRRESWDQLGSLLACWAFAAAGGALSLAGLCLGLAGLIPRRNKRSAAMVGTILNGLVALVAVLFSLYTFILAPHRQQAAATVRAKQVDDEDRRIVGKWAPGQEGVLDEVKNAGGQVLFGGSGVYGGLHVVLMGRWSKPHVPLNPNVALVSLQKWTNIVSLGLPHMPLDEDCLKTLEHFPKLQVLNLEKTGVTDAGLKHLQGLTLLRELTLYDNKITDAGLKELQGLMKLESLNLMKTDVTDAGLEHLKTLKNLKHVYLSMTKVTEQGAEGLRKSLPGVHTPGVHTSR